MELALLWPLRRREQRDGEADKEEKKGRVNHRDKYCFPSPAHTTPPPSHTEHTLVRDINDCNACNIGFRHSLVVSKTDIMQVSFIITWRAAERGLHLQSV